MGMAIPFGVFVDVAQTEIGRKIDHLEPLGQRRDHLLRGAMGQRTEYRVDSVPVQLVDGDEIRKLQPGELREHVGHRLTGFPVSGQRGDAHVGMVDQDADQFGAGIARGAENGDGDRGHGCVSPHRCALVMR